MTRHLPLLLALLMGCSAEAPAARTGEPPLIRVHLTSLADRETVHLVSDGPWSLFDAATGERLEEGDRLDRRLPVRGAKVDPALRLETDTLRIEGRRHHGVLLVRSGPKGARIILETELERYIPGVLAGEMRADFHPAALRAQAVAARTYARSRMLARGEDAEWHVTNEVTDQVFRGTPPAGSRALFDAAESTRGMILLFEGRPISGNFHSTCGGHTANVNEVFGGEEIPPLVGVPCGFCSISPRFQWKLRFPVEEARGDLGLPADPVSAEVTGRGRDGRATSIRFFCPDPEDRDGIDVRWRLGPGRLLGTRIHRVLVADGHLVFEGGGSGHGVGLCQWGAEGMARAGAAAADILSNYYPGATLGRIY